MKTILNNFLVFIFFLFGILNGMAKATPPAPNQKTNQPPPIGHPPLPINEHLLYLLILAAFFGIYIIYSRKLEGKKSV